MTTLENYSQYLLKLDVHLCIGGSNSSCGYLPIRNESVCLPHARMFIAVLFSPIPSQS